MEKMKKKWESRNPDVRVANVPAGVVPEQAIIASILEGRGITLPEEVARFLAPSLSTMHDPFLLRGMDTAVARLIAARNNRESVCIYGDYDVDGITGTALLVSFLRKIG